MSWFRVDDDLNAHRKARLAGAEAMGLWVMCGSYASKHDDGGRMTADEVESVAYSMRLMKWRAAAERLVEVGLWDRDGDAYAFHDWDHYRKEAKAEDVKRAKEASKKARQRSRQGDKTGDVPGDVPGDKGGDKQGDVPWTDEGTEQGTGGGTPGSTRTRSRSRPDPVVPPQPPKGGGAGGDPEIPPGAVELVWLRSLRLAGCSGIEQPRPQAINEMAEHWQAADECGDTWEAFAGRFAERISEWVADIRKNGKQDFNRRWPWPAFAAWYDRIAHAAQAAPDDPWGDPDDAELAAGGHIQ